MVDEGVLSEVYGDEGVSIGLDLVEGLVFHEAESVISLLGAKFILEGVPRQLLEQFDEGADPGE